jgi:hypothetical protein
MTVKCGWCGKMFKDFAEYWKKHSGISCSGYPHRTEEELLEEKKHLAELHEKVKLYREQRRLKKCI